CRNALRLALQHTGPARGTRPVRTRVAISPVPPGGTARRPDPSGPAPAAPSPETPQAARHGVEPRPRRPARRARPAPRVAPAGAAQPGARRPGAARADRVGHLAIRRGDCPADASRRAVLDRRPLRNLVGPQAASID